MLTALLLTLAVRPASAYVSDDASQLRSEMVKDTIDLESDKTEVHRDRAAVRSAKDAYDDAVDAYGKDSPQAGAALKRLERAQLTLHKNLGDREERPVDRSRLSGEKSIQETAAQYKVAPAELEAMRKRGMGWIEIGEAVAISSQSGKPLPEILALRRSGKGWSEIARQFDLQPGKVTKDATAISKIGAKAEQHVESLRRVSSRRSQARQRGANGGHGRSDRRRR